VHFRNIRGRRLDFVETFPDEGDMNMAASLRLYREVGYRYMVMPDHAPKVSGRDPVGTAFAYCYGYIAGALQMMGLEAGGPSGPPLAAPPPS
jgi:mannonate dehydratase